MWEISSFLHMDCQNDVFNQRCHIPYRNRFGVCFSLIVCDGLFNKLIDTVLLFFFDTVLLFRVKSVTPLVNKYRLDTV